MYPDTDVVIVGGGPAGLAASIATRLQGLEVTVVDRRHPPIDKACGEGLMPDGLAILGQLGVEVGSRHLFHGIRYIDGETVAEGRFPGVSGAGVRRLHLHRSLERRARDVGVSLRWGVRVEGLEASGVSTSEGPVAARWIVGADGLRSRVRRWAGLEPSPAGWQRFGVRRHYKLAPWSDCVEVYWADGCEAYVTPVAADEIGVAILWSGRKAGFDRLLESFPRLAARLASGAIVSRDRGCGPLRQRSKAVIRGRVALLGDAAGYVDAITGEGLSVAFHQATALAAALRQDDLAPYARRCRRIARLPDALTHLLLWIERRPVLRRRVVRALASEPAIFSRFLGVHCRAFPVHSLGIRTAPRLLWRLVQS